ncbi:two component, sigma54 specific, transcriptional regulator, Fis family [Fibrisoma limi BUZ 3]|uniref:Two component, sigma54 specific, transcriptional regulator, Fis family n=1 Tax=Fibrisoma limi BUZ 3 TaxID=1185876 RepID=I2GID5_9BACT|nr:sigma-54 dependent transcriptional regulator [Fibrisoma limi]CCH53660.1 two component, sigma54 specific, transcriptional regulator, Fis family [Fibrisoma limi BUZ 3]
MRTHPTHYTDVDDTEQIGTDPSRPGRTILIVDDMPNNISVLYEALTRFNYKVLVARDGKSAIEQAGLAQPDLILLDVMMPGMDGFETCRRLKHQEATRAIPVLFMTALSETIDKVNGFNMGAVDYITKPFQLQEVMARINTHLTLRQLQRELQDANTRLETRVAERTASLAKALAEVETLKNQLQAENTYLREEIRQTNNFEEIVSQSKTFARVLRQVEQVAPTHTSVLILGESGTGKELLARAVHNRSGRKNKALVKINCAALPATLIESELFGHEKGAFTGATAQKAGRFELADGGTLFLDEIGEMPIDLQAKLLRVLQEGEFERVGSTKTLKVNVRLIAATNRDLEKEISEGRFREDLYYRLNVFPIQSLPLRERKEDIPLLVRHFCTKHGPGIGRQIDVIPQEVIDTLMDYHWPGNIRELENVVERSLIISSGRKLELGDWAGNALLRRKNVTPQKTGLITMEEAERNHILAVLEHTRWKVSGKNGAAEILGLIPTTLDSRMKKLGIQRP